MSELEQLYQTAQNTTSDINEHVKALTAYGMMCDSIVEFGCRWGVSTTAFLKAEPRFLLSYDLEIYPQIQNLKRVADAELPNTEFQFKCENTLFTEIPECDLLFLDSYHVEQQVHKELILHAEKARKFLVFHDTVTYRDVGQSAGYKGIWDTIMGFLRYNPQWVMTNHYEHNNGLTVLSRDVNWKNRFVES